MSLKERQERKAFLRRYEAAFDGASDRGRVASTATLVDAHAVAMRVAAASFERDGRRLTDDRAAELEMVCLDHIARRLGLEPTEAAQRCIAEPWHSILDERMHVHLERLETWADLDVHTKRAMAFGLSEHEANDAVPGARGREVARSLRTTMLMSATSRWCPVTDPSTHDLNVFYFAAVRHVEQGTAHLTERIDAGVHLRRASLYDAVAAG